MEQNRPKQTDQQATNAALAALAAAGNSFALGQLWEVNKGFVRRQLWQWYEKNKPVADNAGLSFEDLVQEGYFAVDYAAKHYSAEQGSFTTYLSYALLKQIRTATCGEHTRGVITEDGRRVAVSANPLNECTSLDTPVGEDGSDTALGDLQEDPAELFIRLRSTEKVRCKLCTAHVVKNVLALFQAFPGFDVRSPQTAIQAHVPIVLERGIVQTCFDTGHLCGFCKGLVVLCHLVSDCNPLLILRQLIVVLYKFLLACFDSKVGLTDSNNLFAGVTIHHGKIAGIARQLNIIDFTFCA